MDERNRGVGKGRCLQISLGACKDEVAGLIFGVAVTGGDQCSEKGPGDKIQLDQEKRKGDEGNKGAGLCRTPTAGGIRPPCAFPGAWEEDAGFTMA